MQQNIEAQTNQTSAAQTHAIAASIPRISAVNTCASHARARWYAAATQTTTTTIANTTATIAARA